MKFDQDVLFNVIVHILVYQIVYTVINGYYLEQKVSTCYINKYNKRIVLSSTNNCVSNSLVRVQTFAVSLCLTKKLYFLTATSNTSLDQLQQQLNCFSLLNNTTTTKQKVNKNKKKRPTFKMPILLETELKKKIAAPEKNNFVLKEFFVKTSYNQFILLLIMTKQIISRSHQFAYISPYPFVSFHTITTT